MSKKTIRILIVDDHHMVRESWKTLLQSQEDMEVAGECDNGADAIEQSRLVEPDIILMDINMQPVNGFEATRQIVLQNPRIKIIGLSLNDQPSYVRKLLQLGAKGYVTKHAGPQELIQAIHQVNQGNKYISQDIRKKATDDFFNLE